MKVNTDKEKIKDILTRSVAQLLPSYESLEKELLSGRRLKIYIGADPTGAQLHIGHSTNFILLEKLRQLGHEIIILFGDFTAMIGDPADKDAVRRRLSKKEIEENIKTWEQQVGKVVNLKKEDNPAKILKNSLWLSEMKLPDVIDLMANFTVQQMIERDMFQRRLEERKPIYMHEFLYPLMQGYDSVAMDVDIEVGGTDQIFNMLVGRTLQKKVNNKEKFVIATTLLENPKTGKKLMSKSEGTYIALDDSPNDMFGKTMALPDETIVQIFTDCTYMATEEIQDIKEGLEKGKNPRDAKMKLGYELVKLFHDEDKARKAEDSFVKTFKDKEMPEDSKEIIITKGKKNEKLSKITLEEDLIKSIGEFRRLVAEGAVSNMDTGEKITNPDFVIEEDINLKIGKRRFLKIKVQ